MAYLTDRRHRSGPAVVFVVTGFAATLTGISAASPDLPLAGIGAMVVVIGAALAVAGARTGRRFTTWYWTFAIAAGLVPIIARIVSNNPAVGGITLLVVGLALVAVTPFVSARLGEPDETGPTPVYAAQNPGLPAR